MTGKAVLVRTSFERSEHDLVEKSYDLLRRFEKRTRMAMQNREKAQAC